MNIYIHIGMLLHNIPYKILRGFALDKENIIIKGQQ